MADRTSARLFGKIFGLLAKNPSEEHKAIAKEVFAETDNYDFSSYQMDADDSLMALGLARLGVDPEYPEEGETVLYGEHNEP
ncbi:hypothetical protein [Larkinella terrae]|uniref:Uncharacterized protein n=1 Tax=Larkinella terrae TaxID=2025311 RepID=A0A7K0EIS9_9BACT|nr:hypothetical protein [Larkinella terrae]MRS61760.1 hypothetical protein [Larkinella terrae]